MVCLADIQSDLPRHLHPFVAKQDSSLYTPIDHATWRYIMRLSRAFFATHAHQKYLDGLEQTGIPTDRIPLISEMDEKLKRFGWRAVPIIGFIPPAVFVEFMSLGFLPIACDMRTHEHLAYTPSPDIVHEAAGHAPIIADPAYARFLQNMAEVSRKVILSIHDLNLYEAIRNLSDVKEDPTATPELIAKAQKALDQAVNAVDDVSENMWLARFAWWTIEYGLVGTMEQPKIYGAGLLSSVGESYHCLSAGVRKIPLSVDCIQQGYDITKPQPQLFVTPDFETLQKVLNDLTSRLSFKVGGKVGLERAIAAKTVNTLVLDSGLQLSGKWVEGRWDAKGDLVFIKAQGKTQLSYEDRELPGHSADVHHEGFSSPLGRIKGFGKCLSDFSDAELPKLKDGFEFESGIRVQAGRFGQPVRAQTGPSKGMLLILPLFDCTVTWGSEVLYRPEWGVFDLACGTKLPSVFGGAADREKFLAATGGYVEKPNRPKTNASNQPDRLNQLYATVRRLRDDRPQAAGAASEVASALQRVAEELDRSFPEDWLLRMELLEWPGLDTAPWRQSCKQRLELLMRERTELKELIQRGFEILR